MAEYRPWTFANRDDVRRRDAERFSKQADTYRQRAKEESNPWLGQGRQREQPTNPLDRQLQDDDDDDDSDGGGGFWGGVQDFAGKVGSTALDVINVGEEYIGGPIVGLGSGAWAADRKQDPETGQWYREQNPGVSDLFGGWEGIQQIFTQDPRDTYSEARQGYKEVLQDPELSIAGLSPTASRAVVQIGSDPLLYVGPGAVGKLAAKLPAGVLKTALTARRSPLGALAEGTGVAAPATIAGVGVGTELGERSDLPFGENIGGLLGGLGGSIAAMRVMGRGIDRDMIKEAIDEGEDPFVSAPQYRQVERLRNEDVKTDLDRYQARNLKGGQEFDEEHVKQILRDYDPGQLTPGVVARDINSGEITLISGHHRREVMRRLGMDEGEYRVYDADLSDPDHVRYFEELAARENANVGRMGPDQLARAARRQVGENNRTTREFQDMYGLSSAEAERYVYLSTLPDDLIDEMARRGGRYENLAEIGRIARMVDLPEQDVRGLANRYVFGDQAGIIATDLRKALEESRLVEAARAQQATRAQTSMFETEEFQQAGILDDTMLDAIDQRAAFHHDLRLQRTRLTRLRNDMEREFGEMPELDDARMQLEDALNARVAQVERKLSGVDDGGGVDRGDRAAGAARGAAEPEAPAAPGGAGPGPEQAGFGAAAGATSERAAPDAVNAKEWYHGTGTAGLRATDLDPTMTRVDNLFGEGVYLTDNPEIARGYARARGKRSGEPTVYRAQVNVDKVLDLEGVMPPEVRRIMEQQLETARTSDDDFAALVVEKLEPVLAKQDATGEDAWRALSDAAAEHSADAGIADHEYGDFFFDLGVQLRQLGYDGFTHTGGKRTGKDPHQVLILLDPNDRIAPMGRPGRLTSLEPEAATAVEPPAQTVTPQSGQVPVEFTRGGAPEPQSTLRTVEPPDGQLPPDIAKSDPRYSFGRKQFRLEFDSDVEKALYVVAQTNKSKRDEAFMEFLRGEYPSLSDKQIRQVGRSVRNTIKPLARDADPAQGALRVPRGQYALDVGRPENPRPVGGREAIAGVGEPPRQPGFEGMPPGKEPPLRGRGRNQPFGTEGRPLHDLLKARTRKQISRDKKVMSKSIPEKLRRSLGQMDEGKKHARDQVDPVIREHKRIAHNLTANVVGRIQIEEGALRLAGIEIKQVQDETYHLFANGQDMGFAEDVIEQVSEAGKRGFARLNPQQQEAIAEIGRTNQLINETLQRYGVTPNIDDGIEGEYFGRVALKRQYENLKKGTTSVEYGGKAGKVSRSVGVNRMKQRTIEAIESGLENGIRYDNPWDARAIRLRGKLMMAQDAWIGRELKPLGKTKIKSTAGLDTVKGHPAFNNRWFTRDVAERIQQGLERVEHGQLENSMRSVNSVLTPLRASFDLSATFQQGLRLWLTEPHKAADYWWTVMRSLADAKVYDGALLKMDGEMRALTGGENGLDLLWSQGLHPRDAGRSTDALLFQPGFTQRIGRAGLPGKGIEKGIQKSNEAFSRTLTLFSHHMAMSQYKRLQMAGLEGEALDDALRESMRGINRMFGWTDTQPSRIEEAAVFAPRYTRASIETVALAAEGVVKFGHASREAVMARNHMALLLAEGAGAVWLLNELRGKETEWDPRDPNFLRIRDAGGLDVSPFGTYNTLFRAIAQTAAGQTFPGEGHVKDRFASLKRFGWGKMSPGMRFLYEPFVEGSTYLGRPLDPLGDPLGVATEFGVASLPFGAQALREEGPGAAFIQSFGFSATPMTPGERRNEIRERIAQDRFGKPYEELSGSDKSKVNEDPDIERYQEEVNENTLTREGERAQSLEATLGADRKLDALSEQLDDGVITGEQWRDQYQQIQAELRGSREVLDLRGSDDDIDGWFSLYDEASDESGRIDFEVLEGLQARYAREHPGVEEKVDRIVGTRDNETLREYRQARELAREYFSIPAYAGLELAESRRASTILQAANSMVMYGYARSRDHALMLLMESDPDGVMLARMAADRGSNPERQAWRQRGDVELFHKFYSDATLGQMQAGGTPMFTPR